MLWRSFGSTVAQDQLRKKNDGRTRDGFFPKDMNPNVVHKIHSWILTFFHCCLRIKLSQNKVEHSHIYLTYLSQDGRFSYGILILKSEHCSLINLATAKTKVMYKLHMLNLLSVSPIIPSEQKKMHKLLAGRW